MTTSKSKIRGVNITTTPITAKSRKMKVKYYASKTSLIYFVNEFACDLGIPIEPKPLNDKIQKIK